MIVRRIIFVSGVVFVIIGLMGCGYNFFEKKVIEKKMMLVCVIIMVFVLYWSDVVLMEVLLVDFVIKVVCSVIDG